MHPARARLRRRASTNVAGGRLEVSPRRPIQHHDWRTEAIAPVLGIVEAGDEDREFVTTFMGKQMAGAVCLLAGHAARTGLPPLADRSSAAVTPQIDRDPASTPRMNFNGTVLHALTEPGQWPRWLRPRPWIVSTGTSTSDSDVTCRRSPRCPYARAQNVHLQVVDPFTGWGWGHRSESLVRSLRAKQFSPYRRAHRRSLAIAAARPTRRLPPLHRRRGACFCPAVRSRPDVGFDVVVPESDPTRPTDIRPFAAEDKVFQSAALPGGLASAVLHQVFHDPRHPTEERSWQAASEVGAFWQEADVIDA